MQLVYLQAAYHGRIRNGNKNIIKKLHKNSITNYEIIPMPIGCDTVRVPYTNSYDLTNIAGLFKRGVKIDINSYTRTVILWNSREWERSRKLSEKPCKAAFLIVFFMKI